MYLINDEIVRSLNSKDGYAVQYEVKMGYKIFFITGGLSPEIRKRLIGLGVHDVYLASKNKPEHYEQITAEYQLSDQQIAYICDDIPDIPVLKVAGPSACPQDAISDVKSVVHYQNPFSGGKTCVRAT